MTSTSSPVLLARVCGGCQDIVPLAVTPSADTFYLGWICPRCLADDNDGALDVLGVYATLEDAELGLLTRGIPCLAQAAGPRFRDIALKLLAHVPVSPETVRSIAARHGLGDDLVLHVPRARVA